MAKNESKPYRPNVGMIVFNRDGYVLTGERIQFPGAWQFPQGGIDKGESPIEAAKRELYEEVGIENAELIGEYPDWIEYDFPSSLGITGKLKKYRGQTQKWFLFYWDHPIEECNLDVHEREFTSIRFLPFREVAEQIVSFKRDTYILLEKYFTPLILDKINQKL